LLFRDDVFASLVKQAYNPEANSIMCTHVSWENAARSAWILGCLSTALRKATSERYPAIFPVVDAVFRLRDSLAPWRVELGLSWKGNGLLSPLNEMYEAKYRMDHPKMVDYLRHLLRLVKDNALVAGWFLKHKADALPFVRKILEPLISDLKVRMDVMVVTDDEIRLAELTEVLMAFSAVASGETAVRAEKLLAAIDPGLPTTVPLVSDD